MADLRPGVLHDNLEATMYVRGQTLNVTRYVCVAKPENMHGDGIFFFPYAHVKVFEIFADTGRGTSVTM